MEDFTKIVLWIFGIALLIMGVPTLLLNWHAEGVCNRHQMITGQETQWMQFDECYVKHNGEWMRYSAYEKIIVARDGLAAEAAD